MNPKAALLTIGATLLVVPAAGAGDASDPFGPAPIRDAHLLAQPRLTLPAEPAWTTPAGRWSIEVAGSWASSFSWTQDVPGETPEDRRFLVDGEALVLDLTVRRGFSRHVDGAVRLPVLARGGGHLDGFIDWWHRVFNVPDGDRPLFLRDAFRVEGLTTAGARFSWNDATGAGLGDAEVAARVRVLDGALESPSVALVGRVSLPTATGPFAGNGLGAGAQVLAHAPVSRSFDLHGGAGLTVQGPGPVRGVEYERWRVHAFLAAEWRPWGGVGFVVETSAASRLAANVDRYPGLHWVVNAVARFDVGERLRLDVGFTENIASQLTTTDFAPYVGLSLRP